MEMIFEREGRHGKGPWLDKDSRLRQKLQDKNNFKSSFQMCAVLQPLVLPWGLYPAFLGKECGIFIPGIVMCWGKLTACGA